MVGTLTADSGRPLAKECGLSSAQPWFSRWQSVQATLPSPESIRSANRISPKAACATSNSAVSGKGSIGCSPSDPLSRVSQTRDRSRRPQLATPMQAESSNTNSVHTREVTGPLRDIKRSRVARYERSTNHERDRVTLSERTLGPKR